MSIEVSEDELTQLIFDEGPHVHAWSMFQCRATAKRILEKLRNER